MEELTKTEATKAKQYNAKYFQQGIKATQGGEYIQAGIRNATVKCSSDTFTAPEPITRTSTIRIGKLLPGVVPAFALVKSTAQIAGTLGTTENPTLYGAFALQAGLSITLPAEKIEPLRLGGDIILKLAADYQQGGKIDVRLFFT